MQAPRRATRLHALSTRFLNTHGEHSTIAETLAEPVAHRLITIDSATLPQTFWVLDADTFQPVCFTTGTASRSVVDGWVARAGSDWCVPLAPQVNPV